MASKAKRKPKKAEAAGNGVMALIKELWQAAVGLRDSIEPADYKRYVLPLIFLRFLSLRYQRRRIEAHRSQYGFASGYGRYLAEALPNARRIGFTGTPISFSGADTAEVFGDVIHWYDIKQSQEDGATVPIFYEPRQINLHLAHTDIDAALEEITRDVEVPELEQKKSRWAALAKAAGAKDRVAELATDLLAHFQSRIATLDGKGMVVCMTRENCVSVFDALTARPGCPEVKVVMTGDLGIDPPQWSGAGHITTKVQRDAIKQRMVDPDDPLKFVIVCDMWLTGTDIPCLHTLYIDKPMRGHSIIQAISRVNRVSATSRTVSWSTTSASATICARPGAVLSGWRPRQSRAGACRGSEASVFRCSSRRTRSTAAGRAVRGLA